MKNKVILVIIDGWGIPKNKNQSAFYKANTLFIDKLFQKNPSCLLEASGTSVGLPQGIMGNSEVGHLNIGAGRIIPQSLIRINNAIKNGSLKNNIILKNAFQYAKKHNKNIHLLGLVSDGGIHSHIDHLKALCSIAKENDITKLFIHAFTDGRDSNPNSSLKFLTSIEEHLKKTVGKISTITGRYYAMDRDKRWERTKIAYDALVNNIGETTNNWYDFISDLYKKGITDEFIKPIILLDQKNDPIVKIEEDDVVIFFNFRTDRGRQLTEMLTQKAFTEFNTKPLNLKYITFVEYNETFNNIEVLFKKVNIKNTLGEIISKNNLKQLRIAETEKYPHVTYFFSGGKEEPFNNEERILCPSPKVATYDLKPEMSAESIKNAAIEQIQRNKYDFICINFANMDMVGHTGNFEASIKACETIDQFLREIVEEAIKNNYVIIITSDHGNIEKMIDDDGKPYTSHTTNKVPFILVNAGNLILKDGILANIAPTILKLLNLEKPKEMNYDSLFF